MTDSPASRLLADRKAAFATGEIARPTWSDDLEVQWRDLLKVMTDNQRDGRVLTPDQRIDVQRQWFDLDQQREDALADGWHTFLAAATGKGGQA